MSATMQTPQSIGQVLDAGFKLYGRAFKPTVLLSLAGALVGLLPNVISLLPALAGSATTVVVVLAIAAWIFRLAFYGAVIDQLDDVNSNRNQAGLASSFSVGLRRVASLIGGLILYILAFIASFVPASLAIVAIKVIGPVAGITGFVLLLLFSAWIIVKLSLFMNAIVVDKMGPVAALRESQRLVSGHWWRVATILTIVTIVLAALYFGIIALAALVLPVGNIFTAMKQGIGPASVTLMLFFLVVSLVGGVLGPLLYAVNLVLYRDLQVRKSGGDLAERIAADA